MEGEKSSDSGGKQAFREYKWSDLTIEGWSDEEERRYDDHQKQVASASFLTNLCGFSEVIP